MGVFNLRGDREALSRNSEDYKNKVAEFLKAKGGLVISDSSIEGSTADLKMVKQLPDSQKEVWIEVKDADLSRTEPDFLTELARYFLSYIDLPKGERFDFYIFARNLQAYDKWRHIFEGTLQRDEKVSDLYNRMLEDANLREAERENLEQYELENFRTFVTDTDVYQASYEDLKKKIDQLDSDEKFSDDFFLKERDPIREVNKVKLNLVPVDDSETSIYFYDLKDEYEHSDIRAEAEEAPYWLYKGKMLTLEPVSNYKELQKFILEDSEATRNFRSWRKDKDNPGRAFVLLKMYISYKLSRMGFISKKYRGTHYHYVIHRDMDEEKKKIDGIQYSKVFEDTDEPFVRHKALTTEAKLYDGDLHLILNPTIIYTEDGEEMITGKDAQRLHYSLPMNRYDNNYSVKRELDHWMKIIGITDNQATVFNFGELIEKEMRYRPPKNSDERDQRMSSQGLKQYG